MFASPSSADIYYAVFRHDGKLHRRSLATTVRAIANRKLGDERRKITVVDKRAGKVTLSSLCDECSLIAYPGCSPAGAGSTSGYMLAIPAGIHKC